MGSHSEIGLGDGFWTVPTRNVDQHRHLDPVPGAELHADERRAPEREINKES